MHEGDGDGWSEGKKKNTRKKIEIKFLGE